MKIGLVGNPNSGKTTLFNTLTGVNQRTGNYPGVTTSISKRTISMPNGGQTELLDLPGAYSLYPNTTDEMQLVKLLRDHSSDISLFAYMADITALDKQLLLLTQLLDLGVPCVLLLSKSDLQDQQKTDKITALLQQEFAIPVFAVNYKNEKNVNHLKEFFIQHNGHISKQKKTFYELTEDQKAWIKDGVKSGDESTSYMQLIRAVYPDESNAGIQEAHPMRLNWQINETMARYEKLQTVEQKIARFSDPSSRVLSDKIDTWLTHPVIGTVAFFAILFFVFQAIYAWSEWPMDLIDGAVASAGDSIRSVLGASQFTDFLVDGVVAGIGGVIIFIPQIAILFFLLSLFEESGYMARAVYLFDHIMKRFGLSGRSIVALMSAGACAIPAVMSARTIQNERERLITILVSPFISCAARIPVYTILIGIAVPAVSVLGIFNLKGIAFTGLYILSALVALLSGFLLKKMFKNKQSSALLIELPAYSVPSMRNVLVIVWSKVKAFVWEAGRIILIISMLLWFLGSYGPSQAMQDAEQQAAVQIEQQQLADAEADALLSSKRLEASYAGHIGKWMEPVIRPLGYDWKIGIGLLASFAAREVFVGTMATIYSMGDADEVSLKSRLTNEIDPRTGKHVFSFATSMSLLVFFLLAMQCMSTLAVVKRETKSWKWPILQLFGMTLMAYLAAFVVYQVLS